MQFNSLSEFIAMGGYGFFVWLSYGSCLLILVGIFIASVTSHKSSLKQVEMQIEREQRIKKAKESSV